MGGSGRRCLSPGLGECRCPRSGDASLLALVGPELGPFVVQGGQFKLGPLQLGPVGREGRLQRLLLTAGCRDGGAGPLLGLLGRVGRRPLSRHSLAGGSVGVRLRDGGSLQVADRAELVLVLVVVQRAFFEQDVRVVRREQRAGGSGDFAVHIAGLDVADVVALGGDDIAPRLGHLHLRRGCGGLGHSQFRQRVGELLLSQLLLGAQPLELALQDRRLGAEPADLCGQVVLLLLGRADLVIRRVGRRRGAGPAGGDQHARDRGDHGTRRDPMGPATSGPGLLHGGARFLVT
jgi:hypothetical protein